MVEKVHAIVERRAEMLGILPPVEGSEVRLLSEQEREQLLRGVLSALTVLDLLNSKTRYHGMLPVHISVSPPRDNGAGCLGKVVATKGSDRFVAFHRGQTGGDALMGLVSRLMDGDLDWRVDKPLVVQKPERASQTPKGW